jgi:hypothetical protein
MTNYNLDFDATQPRLAKDVRPLDIIDTREILTNGKRRTTGLQRALDRTSTVAAIQNIFKDFSVDAPEPPRNLYGEQPRVSSDGVKMEAENITPQPACDCGCPMCLSGQHGSCVAPPGERCWLAHPDLIDHATPKPTNDAEPKSEITADFLRTSSGELRKIIRRFRRANGVMVTQYDGGELWQIA